MIGLAEPEMQHASRVRGLGSIRMTEYKMANRAVLQAHGELHASCKCAGRARTILWRKRRQP